jgi:hypothetical protein
MKLFLSQYVSSRPDDRRLTVPRELARPRIVSPE